MQLQAAKYKVLKDRTWQWYILSIKLEPFAVSFSYNTVVSWEKYALIFYFDDDVARR